MYFTYIFIGVDENRADGFYQSQLKLRSTNRKKTLGIGCHHCVQTFRHISFYAMNNLFASKHAMKSLAQVFSFNFRGFNYLMGSAYMKYIHVSWSVCQWRYYYV